MIAAGTTKHRWIGPLMVAITAAIMLDWSWGTWPDCVLDFGRELYVPWRLSEGELLYRDIVSYFNGPFSPYLHALMFKIFGASLRTLVIFNLFVIAALAAMMYTLIRRAFSEVAAAAAGMLFFILFAFAQLTFAGNYNFLCPYSYELPHGITLSAASILCLDNWRISARRRSLIASGFLLGLVFLTKAEVFAAAAVALLCTLSAILWISRRKPVELIFFVMAAVIPIAIALLALRSAGLPFADALRGIAGAWQFVSNRRLVSMPFFNELAGTNDLAESGRIILLWCCGYAAVFGIPIVLGLALRSKGDRTAVTSAIVLAGALLVAGLFWRQRIDWNNFIRPAPVVLGIVAIVMLAKLVRTRRDDRALVFMLALWSLAMLAKMALNAHIYHYGFALAMPATLVMSAVVIDLIPCAISRAGGKGNVSRAAALAILIAAIYPQLRVMHEFWSDKTVIVGEGADAFRADARGHIVNAAIDAIRSSPPSHTLAVVPEGLIVNYLARRVNPTRQLNFTPPALAMYGESAMLRMFERNPPDEILLVTIDESEYGPRYFGIDYGQALGGWIKRYYRRPQSWQDPHSPFAMMLVHLTEGGIRPTMYPD